MVRPELKTEEPDAVLPLRMTPSLPKGLLLPLFLFLLTLATTTIFGSAVYYTFEHNQPLSVDSIYDSYLRVARLDREVLYGFEFSLPLLLILLAHELGHYRECRRRSVESSVPYFLPSPSLFGTFGAFIKMRSPIYSRAGLFDIGFKGPIAGFVVLLPFLVAGVMASKVLGRPQSGDGLQFGLPLVLRLLERMLFPGIDAGRILLHPTALAAWAGLFATALNLLPIGQLDGGHLVYALGGARPHRMVTYCFLVVLAGAGFFYWAWWVWAAIMFFVGRRHPLVFDNTPVGQSRRLQTAAAILMFILSVTVVPVRFL